MKTIREDANEESKYGSDDEPYFGNDSGNKKFDSEEEAAYKKRKS